MSGTSSCSVRAPTWRSIEYMHSFSYYLLWQAWPMLGFFLTVVQQNVCDTPILNNSTRQQERAPVGSCFAEHK